MLTRARVDDHVTGQAREFLGLVNSLEAQCWDEVPHLLVELEDAARGGLIAVGYVAYEAAPAFDLSLTVCEIDGTLPVAHFGLFEQTKVVELVTPPQGDAIAGKWIPTWDEHAHARKVSSIKDRIREGWTYQTNLTARLKSHYGGDPFELYRQLAGSQRGRYNTYLETDDWAICSASPELFFDLDKNVVTCTPMKGTSRRGRYPAEDTALAAHLVSSPKERAENVMIVDLIRSDLGKLAAPGAVSMSDLFALERYRTVWQLTSTIRASLRPNTALGDVFAALFPCGSVTGAPKVSTMALIADLEASPRGPYCGAIGIVEPAEQGISARFSVGIRTAVVDRTCGVASYGAGGAITWDSDPAAEWAELQAKTKVLTLRDQRFGLFETMRAEPNGNLVNLDRHLERLAASAAYFDIPFDKSVAGQRLAETVTATDFARRVRLDLSPEGEFSVVAVQLDEHVVKPIRLAIDCERVDQSDEMLFHKTTNRQRYELAASRFSTADDVILVNLRQEVTETTRASLAVWLDDRWWTPDLDCGLLPGVERSRLLDSGMLAERRIALDELIVAPKLATFSSVHGWREARLVSSLKRTDC